jgi:hypothetical protein
LKHPEFVKLQQQIAASNERATQAEDERKQMEVARQGDEQKGAIMAALEGLGVPAGRREGAYLVISAKGQVRHNDANAVKYFQKRDGFDFEDELAVADGVAKWAATDEGKSYLPAVQAAGSGNRGGLPPTQMGKDGKPSREWLQHRLGVLLMDPKKRGT